VKSATVEGRMSPIFFDDEVIGFRLQVRDVVRETFVLNSKCSVRLQGAK
jgi:hypothetical protein